MIIKDWCFLHWISVQQNILRKLVIPAGEAALETSYILQAWQRELNSLNKKSLWLHSFFSDTRYRLSLVP